MKTDRTRLDTTRREFLARAAAAAALAGLAGGTLNAVAGEKGDAKADKAQKSDKKAKKGKAPTLLILGGTNFLGPQVVEAALKKQWTVTLFNRGKTHPE